MENRKELIILYINEDGSLHQVLLNDMETEKIASEITKIFAAKKTNVMVDDTKLRLCKEVETNGKENSSKI